MKSELKMSVILGHWFLSSLQILLVFAVISSNILSAAGSTGSMEPPSSAASTVSPSLSATTIASTVTTTTSIPSTVAPDPPSPPTNLTVSPVKSGGLNVSWITSNGTEYSKVFVNGSFHNNTSGSNIFVVGLIGGSFYVISIRACVHTNICSDATESGSSTYPSLPGPLKPEDQSISSINISWIQYGHFSNFSVTVDYNDFPNVIHDSHIEPSGNSVSNSTPVHCSISGLLVPGGNYSVSVSAVMDNLQSDFQWHPFRTKPDQPQNVTVPYRTNDSLWITWDQLGVVDNFSWSVNDTDTPNGTLNATLNNESCYCWNSWKMSLNITDLPTAGAMYSIDIIANVPDVISDPRNVLHSTVPNVPEAFASKTESSKSISLSWKKPEGLLESYELLYSSGSSINYTKSVHASDVHVAYSLTNLSSDSNYKIELRAMSFGQMSVNAVTSNWTLPDKVSDVKNVSFAETSVKISWKAPFRHDNVNSYHLNIANSTDCVQFVYLFCLGTYQSLTHGTCASTVNRNVSDCKTVLELDHTFKELKPSTAYNISIAAVNPGGSSHPEAISVVTKNLEPKPNKDNGWIAGVVIGCLLGVLLIIALAFLLLRWRQNKPPFKGKNHSSSASYKGGEENPTYEEEPEPVAVGAFVDYTQKMSQDSNYLYACEYMLLTKLSAKNTTDAAELQDNRNKNRYTDILPYDNSRVKLIPDEDVSEGDGSDYINASYMPGFNSKREYIAAQGPMRSTVDDFWLMIWQQRVSLIVMVTNLSERGREKCEQYWPDDTEGPLCYGNINVVLQSESPKDFYTIRVLEVSVGSEKRQIVHYHFLTWPDFGVPEDIEHILTYVNDIRRSIQGNAPVLVHCSAGVGRTGTFIVVDHLLQLIKREPTIDLFHLVLDLRQHRPKMIQAESQYVFAHECIKMAIEKGLHRGSSMMIVEDEQAANGDCLYANASETANEIPLYANAEEIPAQLQTYHSGLTTTEEDD